MSEQLGLAGQANTPRWHGQSGFFEIWFFVVFDLDTNQAYWFRYTTFAPRQHVRETRRATVWAAAFDANACHPLAAKVIHPIEAYATDAARGEVRIGESGFDEQSCRGSVADQGHSLVWELAFTPAARPAHRAPWFMSHRIPLPTRVLHANSGVEFTGSVLIDGQLRKLQRAPGLQKHIWGTRRVDELFWLYCPRFAEDPGARLEATAVRPHTRLLERIEVPRLTPMWIETARGASNLFGASHMLTNRVTRNDDISLRFRSHSLTRRAQAEATCTRESLVGYVYRDPAAHDLYVAQSDVASCVLALRTRPHALTRFGPEERFTADRCAALEFHSREPIEGVTYLGWDEGARPPCSAHTPAQRPLPHGRRSDRGADPQS